MGAGQRHEGIEDISVPTLTNVLADSILRNRLSKSKSTEAEEIEEIENSLTRVVAEKETLIKTKDEEITLLKKQTADAETKATEVQQTAKQINNDKDKVENDKVKVELELTQTKGELSNLKKERDRLKLAIKLIIGFLIVALGFGITFILPTWISWPWLIGHPHRLGIQLCFFYCWLGASWILLDNNKNRRWLAFGTIIVASLVALAQIV